MTNPELFRVLTKVLLPNPKAYFSNNTPPLHHYAKDKRPKAIKGHVKYSPAAKQRKNRGTRLNTK